MAKGPVKTGSAKAVSLRFQCEPSRPAVKPTAAGDLYFHDLLCRLPAAVYATDAEGRINFFNHAAAELWGRKPRPGELWCGSPRIFNPDGTPLPLDECPMAVTLKTGAPVHGQEIIVERPDGMRRNILPHPEPLRDGSGKIIGAINMLVDITGRKHKEEAAGRWAAIVESSDDAIVGKDVNGIINSWNHGAEQLFGYRADEVIGKPITILIPTERLAEEAEILERIRRGQRVEHFETVRVRKDGSRLDVSLTISPFKNASGKVIGASKIARDITARRRAEACQQAIYKLVATVNRMNGWAEIYDVALDAILQCQHADRASILCCDSDGIMHFKAWRGLSPEYRAAVEGHTPWGRDEPQPQPVFIEDVLKAGLDKPIFAAVRREGIRALAFIPITYENRLLGKFMIYYNEPHRFTRDEIQPAETIAIQVAFAIERKRVEDELKLARDEAQKADHAKDVFLATLSHELRTPLSPVLLLAGEAAQNPDLPPGVRTAFDTIRKNVEFEARLIDDMLDLTRITHGKFVLDMAPVKIHTVLQDSVSHVRGDVEQKNIGLALKLEAKSELVMGDAVRLRQIFWNVLKNAAKFTPDNGKIFIETEDSNSRLIIRIKDTGIGLDPDETAHIFNAFSQGEVGTVSGGLGLGLTISRKLIEAHSGSISASSPGKGRGSTFTIELPLLQKAKPVSGTPRAAPGAATVSTARKLSQSISVLLVEDHEPTSAVLTQLLLRRNYKVKTAASLAEARLFAGKEDFQLLISDIGLPDGSGFDLMKELRKRNVKGIALTGYGMEHDIERSRDAGFTAHLTKPVRIQSLDDVLATALAAEP